MKISNYKFGSLLMAGKKFTNDIIIHQTWIDDWWRASGHSVIPDDLTEIIQRKPQFIVFGCGASSQMQLTRSTKNLLQQKEIKFLTKNTQAAVKNYNQLLEQGTDVAGAFHLTC